MVRVEGGPPSTSHRRPSGCSMRAASPCPMERKVTMSRPTGTGRTQRAMSARRAAAAGCRRSGRRAARASAPGKPTAGERGGTSRMVRRASPTCAAASATARASRAAGSGSRDASSAQGTEIPAISGLARRLVSKVRGESCWKIQAVTGRVPRVAPSEAPSEVAIRESHRGVSGGTSRVIAGDHHRIPATAPNDISAPGCTACSGSIPSTATAAPPRRLQASTARASSRPAQASPTITAARRAETGQPTRFP